MSFYVDHAGSLSNCRRTASGGFIVDATLARVGTLDYLDGKGGTITHFNPPEVLTQDMDALKTAPVTHRHPKAMVTPTTYKDVVAGHVVGEPVFADGHLKATLAIQDADLIDAIEAGTSRQVSMGYMANSVEDSGEFEGKPYQMRREAIKWNHIAILPSGRAGTARLMLDGADIPYHEDTMKIKVGGKEIEVTEAQLQATVDELEGKLAVTSAQVEKLQGELAVATSDAAIDARIKERDEKVAKAAAKTAKVEKLKAAGVVCDGRSDEYIDGAFELLAKLPKGDGETELNTVVTDEADVEVVDEAPKPDARAAMIARNRAKSRKAG